MKQFLTRFSPPRFIDPEKTRQAELLNGVSLVLLVILSLLLLTNIVQKSILGTAANPILIILILSQLVGQYMIRRGWVRRAGLFWLLISWVSVTWFASVADGVRDVVLFTYVTILLGAGYMYGWRAVLVFSVWSILAVWVLAFYEVTGLTSPVLTSPVRIGLYLTAILIIVSFQAYYIVNTLKRAIDESTFELNARQQAEENYRTIVENSAHGIFQSTPQGKYIRANPALARIYGYDSPEDYIQSIDAISDQVYVDPSDRDRFKRTLSEQGAIQGFEARNRRKDGSIIWIFCNAHAVRDTRGNILYYEGTIEDITERKETNAERERLLGELSAKNAELERFVYTVSHDLKSPLVTIVGFLGFVEEDFKNGDAEALHKDMERIYHAAFKMQDLLKDLLDLSRIGRMMNEPQTIAFDTLVNEAVELTQGRLHERRIQVNIHPNLPYVHGDAKRLLELVQNLIDNAAKYMGDQPDPQIEIGASGFENGKPVFFVRDNGMGIASEHHERIFGLFNKLDPKVEGTGVGLALVKRIVEFYGGRIWVESGIGKGSTFYFSLPAGEDLQSR